MSRSIKRASFVCGLALFYALQAFHAGYNIDGDSLRDLFRALDIVDHHTFYPLGAAAGGLRFSLTSIYYYFMALPLFVSRSMTAILAWIVAWQVATVLAVWSTTRRLFDQRTAIVVAGAFVLSDFIEANYLRVTFSNYCLITGVLMVRCQYEFQVARRGIFLVGCFFFLSLAMNFHFASVSLALVLLLGSIALRENASAWQFGVAAAAGLLPLMPALGATEVLPNGPFAPGAWLEFLHQNSGLVPVAVAALFAARSGSLLQRNRLWLAALLVVAAVSIPILLVAIGFSPPGPFRFFNFAIDLTHSEDGSADVGLAFLVLKTMWLVLGEMAGFGSEPLATIGRILFWWCVVLGIRRIAATSLAFARGEMDRNQAGGSLITLIWLGATIPLGLWSCVGSFPSARYLSNAIVPLLLVFALGLDELQRRYAMTMDALLSRSLEKIRQHRRLATLFALPATLLAGIIVSPITWAVLSSSLQRVVGSQLSPRRRQAAVGLATAGLAAWMIGVHNLSVNAPDIRVTEALLASSRHHLGLNHDAILARLHGTTNDSWGFCDWRFGSCLIQLELDNDRDLGPPRNPYEHFRLVDASHAPPNAIALNVSSGQGGPLLAAVPYLPALDSAHARLLPRGITLALPYRAIMESSTESRYIHPPSTIPWAESDGPIHIEVHRDATSTLDGLEVDVGPRDRFESCLIDLTNDGVPVAATRFHSEMLYRYRYRLVDPAHASTVGLSISGCHVRFLDVFDIPAEESTAQPPNCEGDCRLQRSSEIEIASVES